jgi:hypothetical protein
MLDARVRRRDYARIDIPLVHSGFVILLIGYLVLVAGNVLDGVLREQEGAGRNRRAVCCRVGTCVRFSTGWGIFVSLWESLLTLLPLRQAAHQTAKWAK